MKLRPVYLTTEPKKEVTNCTGSFVQPKFYNSKEGFDGVFTKVLSFKKYTL